MFIQPSHPALQYMGRIDTANPNQPIWVYPYTQVSFRTTGTSLRIQCINRWNYGENYVGAVIDGMQVKVRIPENDVPVTLVLAEFLPNVEHDVTIFKRQDGEHYLEILGFEVDDNATVSTPRFGITAGITNNTTDSVLATKPLPLRRIEVFGDSVSCGERNEATTFTGKADPEVDLSSYSNSWYSYAAITARNLNAQLHDVSQGDAALLDGIGWFDGPDYTGMESIWDRIEYNLTLGVSKPWEFSAYTPQVVIIALGQNNAHPHDFMAEDYDGKQALHWRKRYADFIFALRRTYPNATIICTTTVLMHDAAWDRAIDEVCAAVKDSKVHHFMYSRNGSATPGHPRIAEHEEMAQELTAFITSLGDQIWD